MPQTETKEVLKYKGFPLVRSGNMIYYGNMADKYIILMHIQESKKTGGMDVATGVSVSLQYTESGIKVKDRIVKRAEKNGLFAAMELAEIWLTRALAGK